MREIAKTVGTCGEALARAARQVWQRVRFSPRWQQALAPAERRIANVSVGPWSRHERREAASMVAPAPTIAPVVEDLDDAFRDGVTGKADLMETMGTLAREQPEAANRIPRRDRSVGLLSGAGEPRGVHDDPERDPSVDVSSASSARRSRPDAAPASSTHSDSTRRLDDQASAGTPLPEALRGRVREAVGPGGDAMRVHVDERADQLARGHNADAVTIGADVFFRRGHYVPQEPRGFALLVHEAIHVREAGQPSNAQNRRGVGVLEEERVAGDHERAALMSASGFAPAPADGRTGLAVPPASSVRAPFPALGSRAGRAGRAGMAAAATPAGNLGDKAARSPTLPGAAAVRPMTASTDRAVETAAPFDASTLKRDLYRDLLRQIRTEMERGG